MSTTDGYVKVQQYAPDGQEDWVGIITEVRQQWLRREFQGRYVCCSHVRCDWDWFDHHVARRIKTHLLDMECDPTDTRSGLLFRAYSIALENSLANRRAAESEPSTATSDDGHWGDDPLNLCTESQPRKDSLDASTEIKDEAVPGSNTSDEPWDLPPPLCSVPIPIRASQAPDGQLPESSDH